MPKIPLRQKLFLIVFSALFTLVSIEAGLRTAGFIFLAIQEHQNRTAFHEHDFYRILCIGESTTFLGGDDSYPNQLEKILNNSGVPKSFKVINKGVPGLDTNFIMGNLNSWLDRYTPDMVIAMMGINDCTQLVPSNQETFHEHLRAFFQNLRILKLSRWLRNAFSHSKSQKETMSPPDPLGTTNADTSLHRHEEEAPPPFATMVTLILNKKPRAYREAYIAGIFSAGFGNYPKAEEIFKKLLIANEDPDVERWLQMKLGECFLKQKKHEDLLALTGHKLAKNPEDYEANHWVTVLLKEYAEGTDRLMRFLEEKSKQTPQSIPLHDLLEYCYTWVKDEDNASLHRRDAQRLRMQFYGATTRANHQKLSALLFEKRIRGVFVQYPLRNLSSLKQMVGPAAGSKNIVYVDNEKSFQDAVRAASYEDYFSDRFAGNFGHCTPKGNRLLAQNVANVILKEIPRR